MRALTILLSIILPFLTLELQAQTSSEKLIKEGVSMHDKGNYEGAIKLYKEALKVNPTSMSAVYEMSLSYLRMKEYDEALKYSSQVIEHDFQPLLMDAYVVKSTALAETKKMDEAVTLLEEAITRCGETYLLCFNMGLCYYNKKEIDRAINYLQRAIEIDATHSSAFLLYAYALNDADKWLQSFYSFHFFLLLEPNTARAKDAFSEMYDLISVELPDGSPRLEAVNGINRHELYKALQRLIPQSDSLREKSEFFEKASQLIFFNLSNLQTEGRADLLWSFFVPVYSELLKSGHFDTYSKYVGVSYFPESLEWWESNKDKVDDFIDWFENGDSDLDEDEDSQFEDGPYDQLLEGEEDESDLD